MRSQQAISHHAVDRVVGMRRQLGELRGELERLAKLAIVELVDAKAP